MLLITHCNAPHFFSTLIHLTRSNLLSSRQPCTIPRVLIHTVSSFHLSLFSPLWATVPAGTSTSSASMPSSLCHHPCLFLTGSASCTSFALLKVFHKCSFCSFGNSVNGWDDVDQQRNKLKVKRISCPPFILFLFPLPSSPPLSTVLSSTSIYSWIFPLGGGGGRSWTLWTNTPYIKLEACHHSSPLQLYPSVPNASSLLLRLSLPSLCPLSGMSFQQACQS